MIQVTDAMVASAMRAYRLLPADLNTPHPDGMYIDHLRMRDAIQAALDAAPNEPLRVALDEYGRFTLPPILDEPVVTDAGLDGPGTSDATGQATIVVNHPRVLAGSYEIAVHLGVPWIEAARWIAFRDENGFPAPLAAPYEDAPPEDGAFDLDAVDAWRKARKAADG